MSAGQPHVLAIDLGTSGPKAALVGLGGGLAATGQRTVETLHLPDGGVEQDPEAVWTACLEAARDAVVASSLEPSDVVAVICTSQYSSVVPVDAEGRPTMNMVLWLDQRGDLERLRELERFPRRADSLWRQLVWLRIHGLPPVTGGSDSLSHIRWVRYARPDVYERTRTFLEPMDYLTLRLTGRCTANQCTAFMKLLTDNRRLGVTDYHPRLLEASLIDREKLPELVPLQEIVGTLRPEVAAQLGLSATTPVVTGLNDTQAGGMGTAVFRGSHAAISIGSTAVMISHVERKKTDVRHAILSMPSPVADTWFVMAENGVAGGALEHFVRELASPGPRAASEGGRYEAVDAMAAAVDPGSEGVLFLPWLSGSMAPSAERSMRGGFLNLGLDTRRAHMARAVLEGVALNLAWLRPAVERFVRRRFDRFLFFGGGAESVLWAQILADVLGAPVDQLEQPRFTACVGAALLAFERLGLLELGDFEERVRVKRRYEPRAEHRGLYDQRVTQFIAAHRGIRPIFRALNG